MHLDGKGFRYPNWPAVNKENSRGSRDKEEGKRGREGEQWNATISMELMSGWTVVSTLSNEKWQRIEKKRGWQPGWTECNYEISSSCTVLKNEILDETDNWMGAVGKLCTLFLKTSTVFILLSMSSNYGGGGEVVFIVFIM